MTHPTNVRHHPSSPLLELAAAVSRLPLRARPLSIRVAAPLNAGGWALLFARLRVDLVTEPAARFRARLRRDRDPCLSILGRGATAIPQEWAVLRTVCEGIAAAAATLPRGCIPVTLLTPGRQASVSLARHLLRQGPGSVTIVSGPSDLVRTACLAEAARRMSAARGAEVLWTTLWGLEDAFAGTPLHVVPERPREGAGLVIVTGADGLLTGDMVSRVRRMRARLGTAHASLVLSGRFAADAGVGLAGILPAGTTCFAVDGGPGGGAGSRIPPPHGHWRTGGGSDAEPSDRRLQTLAQRRRVYVAAVEALPARRSRCELRAAIAAVASEGADHRPPSEATVLRWLARHRQGAGVPAVAARRQGPRTVARLPAGVEHVIAEVIGSLATVPGGWSSPARIHGIVRDVLRHLAAVEGEVWPEPSPAAVHRRLAAWKARARRAGQLGFGS